MQQNCESSESKLEMDQTSAVPRTDERYRIIDFDPTIPCSKSRHVNHHHHNPSASLSSYGSTEMSSPTFNRLKKKAWSFHGKSLNESIVNSSSLGQLSSDRQEIRSNNYLRRNDDKNKESYQSIPKFQGTTKSPSDPFSIRNSSVRSSSLKSKSFTITDFLFALIYAFVNVIISVPALYGYSAVIFSDDCYQSHMNALSKLVIFSSAIHQMAFCCCSSLPFAIATVQDAGLIFLNTMSTKIAKKILEDEDGGTIEEVVSTAMVLLSLSTALLGLVLMLLGHFRLAE